MFAINEYSLDGLSDMFVGQLSATPLTSTPVWAKTWAARTPFNRTKVAMAFWFCLSVFKSPSLGFIVESALVVAILLFARSVNDQ